ncbi:MAG TPA: ParA family protein [Chthoniobacterales bacterium]|nr:ParA family protein [Chthoniobacterales bacterium]
MSRPPPQQLAPVLSVFNMKGGVGKTIIAANLFRELYRNIGPQKKTLLIDFDAQFNLTQQVLNQPTYEALLAKKKSIWFVVEPEAPASIFVTSKSDLEDVGSPFDYTTRLKWTNTGSELHLLPGDFQMAMLNLREKAESLHLPRKRFANLVRRAREECALVVIDCNPSSSFLTHCAVENSTHLLVPVRPDKYSMRGLEMTAQYVGKLPGLRHRPEILIIFNGVAAVESGVEQAVLAHADYGPRALRTRIRTTAVLAARSDYTGFGADRGVKNTRNVRAILTAAAVELRELLHIKI